MVEPADVGAGSSRRRRTWIRAAKWGAFVVVGVFVGWALVRQLGQLRGARLHFDPLYLGGAAALATAGRALISLTYHFALRAGGGSPGWPGLLAVAWVPQLGKYVPGKVAGMLGAVWLLRDMGVRTLRAAGVVFVLTALLVVVGLMTGVPLLLFSEVGARAGGAWAWCLLVLFAGATCLHPRVLYGVGDFVLRRMGREPVRARLRVRDYLLPGATIFLQWCCVGLGLWCVARSMTTVSLRSAPMMVSAAALAQTLGFLAVFAPAGVGVLEGVLLVLLTPRLGQGAAAVVIVSARVLNTLVDVVLAGVGVWILHRLGGAGSFPRRGKGGNSESRARELQTRSEAANDQTPNEPL